MAKDAVVIQKRGQLIFNCCIILIWLITTFIILKREMTMRRKQKSTRLIPKWSKYFSIICIASGFCSGLFLLLSFINYLCKFTLFLFVCTLSIQCISMGFYQLFGLYYCFENAQDHIISTNNGYPKIYFIIMYIIGIIVGINYILTISLNNDNPVFRSQCGINNKFEFYYSYNPIKLYQNDKTVILIWTGLMVISYTFWDFVTLISYIYRIRSFKTFVNLSRKNNKRYKRIMITLYKISILTVFYQSMSFFGGLLYVALFPFIPDLFTIIVLTAFNASVIWSYSMYLMQDHNQTQYRKFLNIISCCCVCCCNFCDKFVMEQINDLNVVKYNDQETSNMESTNGVTSNYGTGDDVTGDDVTGDDVIGNDGSGDIDQDTKQVTVTDNDSVNVEMYTIQSDIETDNTLNKDIMDVSSNKYNSTCL